MEEITKNVTRGKKMEEKRIGGDAGGVMEVSLCLARWIAVEERRSKTGALSRRSAARGSQSTVGGLGLESWWFSLGVVLVWWRVDVTPRP